MDARLQVACAYGEKRCHRLLRTPLQRKCLSHVGAPVVSGLFAGLSAAFPGAAAWLSQLWFQSIIAFIATVVALYLVGWAANRVFGQRLLAALDRMIERIPLVHSIYGGAK